jgi:NADH-quinone oxidoreductase subunit A
MGQYLPIVVLALLTVAFVVLSRVFSGLLNPARPTPAKTAPYECGIVPGREPPERFPVRFYLVAMIFIVFDIEIIFFFPWATVFRELGAFGLGAILIFAVAVFESFVYLIGNGALDWGPLKKGAPSEVVSPARTAATTIRRVGLEGRESLPAESVDATAATHDHPHAPGAAA